jgi:nucleotide-binding universal stress UspA family protein
MKKIIIPVDFSKHSEYALETAAALAKQHNSELIVMHMLELSESIISTTSSQRNDETAFMLMVANKNFETFLDQPYLEGLTVTPMIKHHKVLKEVSEIAQQVNADLIVIGSRGHSDHDGIFTGSNTEKVVRYSETPVLVVKTKPESVDFKTSVLATDFSEKSINAVKKALKVLNNLSHKVTLLYVNTPNTDFLNTDEIEEKVSLFFEVSKLKREDLNIDFTTDYDVEDGVLNYVKRTDTEVIAMITNGRKGLSHLFGGSISEDIVNHAKLPVVTFKL